MWIFHNLLYKVVALLVACILWSAAQGIRSAQSTLDVPIEIRNLPPDLVVVWQSHERVNMRIEGSRAAVRGAQKDPVHYGVSLEGVKPGSHTFPVTRDRFAALRRGARVLAHSPETVRFEVEPVLSKRVRVKLNLVGTPAPGYRVAATRVEPQIVEIEGARSKVRRMREVMTERVDVSDLQESLTQQVLLAPGVDHVWRGGEGERGDPVRVEVTIEGEAKTANGGRAPRAAAGGQR